MDRIEGIRRTVVRRINVQPGSREALEIEHGRIWDTTELTQDFQVKALAAPFVMVRRRSDGRLGSLLFQLHPRFYYAFKENY